MDGSRLNYIESIFQELVAVPEHQRQALLEIRCSNDPQTRDMVSRLLSHDSNGMGDFLNRPVVPLEDLSAEPAAPQRVGTYEITRFMGQGGMGVVYEARQQSPRREVALKLIRAGLTSPSSLSRFRFEAEVLGRLQHPGIARVYEAGTTQVQSESGTSSSQPFIAMELVHGKPLVAHVADAGLDVRQRLELIARVCDAVQYAHQRGVIHRDLKPGNILVDDSGPKIVDFGVARATRDDLPALTFQTGVGQLVGTIAYMSPEQLAASSDEADAISDVYALGVVAFELLTGRLPFDVTGVPLPTAIRTICENDPIPAGRLCRELSGDVEAILNKALEKSRERRYQSALQFAEDIRRYLRHEPVIARPPSALYRFRRFARRNRGLVAGAGLALVAVVAALSLALRALQVASRERDEKTVALSAEQAARAEAVEVTRFLTAMLASVDPAKKGRDVRVMDILDDASIRVDNEFSDRPLVAATLRQTIGSTYLALGAYDRADLQLRQALLTRTDLLGRDAPSSLESLQTLGVLLSNWGHYDEAELLLDELLALSTETFGEDSKETLSAMNELAILYRRQGRFDEAASLFERVITSRAELSGEDDLDRLSAMNNLGVVYRRLGKYAHARELYEDVLTRRRRILGDEHPDTLTTMNNLAHLYRVLNQFEEGAALHARTLEIRRRVLGNEHPHTLMSMDNLAMLLVDLDRHDSALPLYEEAIAAKIRVLGAEHPETLVSRNNLSVLLYEKREFDRAEMMQRELLDARRRVLGSNHMETVTSMTNLAKTCTAQSKYGEAEQLHLEALACLRKTVKPDHPDVIITLQFLAELSILQGNTETAIAYFQEALAAHQARNPTHAGLTEIHRGLADALRSLGRTDEADAVINATQAPAGGLDEIEALRSKVGD